MQTGPNFVVNTLADTDDGSCDALGQGTGNHDCTLREAINAANAYGDGGVITFNMSGTIVLTGTLPQVVQTLTIDGSAQSVVLQGASGAPIMTAHSFSFHNGEYLYLTLNALTFTQGSNGLNATFVNATVTNCTFDSINAGNAGGAAVAVGNTTFTTVANSTFSNNTSAQGAGVNVSGYQLVLYNSTFNGNTSTFGNVAALSFGGTRAFIRNNIFARSNAYSCQAPGIDASNRADDNSCGSATQVTAAQLNLGPLKQNGGPTKTIALLPGSVAINAGDVAICTSAEVGNRDQRGDARVSGSDQACDVGAYESMTQGPLTPLAAWRMLQGLAADGSQDLANPSGDGIANLLKYAFNLAPNAGDVNRPNAVTLPANGTAGLPRVGYDGQGRLVLEFVRRKAASTGGIAYIVETGPDLVNWSALGLTNANVTSIDATWERVSVTDPAVSAKRFGRVRVHTLGYYFNDFNAALGPATLYGSAVWTNAAVQLTDTVGGVAGSVIFNGITPGPYASGFRAQFNLQFGPTTTGVPADGGSFAVGALPSGAWGETGPGGPHSIAVGFDTYENGGDGSIGIHLWVNGVHLTSNPINPFTNGVLVPVEVSYDAGSGVTVKFNGTTVFNNVPVSGFGLLPGDQFGFGARTGGASERAVVDDVQIAPR